MKETNQGQYDTFRIFNKQTGKQRLIQSPHPALKSKQKKLIHLYRKFPLHSACSCRKGFGPIDAAKPHLGARYLLKVDISNCYQQIEINKVKQVILNSDISDPLKNIMISNLDTCFIRWKNKDILPTGSPTSPILCNIALSEIDQTIHNLTFEQNYIYTRYMDDLNISTFDNCRKWNLMNDVISILSLSGYPINKKKTKWFGKGNNDAKIIAGINLETISRRSVKRMLRARLNNLAKAKTPMDPKTQGYLAYIKSIDRNTYINLLDYYNKRLNYTSEDLDFSLEK